MKPFFALLALAMAMPTSNSAAAPADDSALWLEQVTSPEALDWVAKQDSASTLALTQSDGFKTMSDRFLKILDSKERIPGVEKIGDRYYNFWRDAAHVRGIWRRTTLEEYRKPSPAWETVLDLDALGAAEKENWVWHGADVLPPDNVRCLVSLSRGGADASVVREFDLSTKAFVAGGFELPESKSSATWIDRDRLFVSVAFDSSTMTTSGYPRIVREWRRGEPLASAKTVYEGQESDVAVSAFHSHMPGFPRDFVMRGVTFYSNEMFLRREGRLVKIEKPDDAEASTWREWLLIQPRTDWTVGGKTYTAGALLAANLEDYLAGKRQIHVLYQPGERTSLSGFTATLDALVLDILDNVRGRLEIVRWSKGAWTHAPVRGLPEFGSIGASAVDPYASNDYWLTVTDFLTPTTLSLANVNTGEREKLKQTPTFFDGSRDAVTQHEAVSKDGTRIPYFQVAPRGMALDGSSPTLLTGYGGFEVPELPYYSGVQGSGWIERGGVLVVANIRGGGEFGPRWHQAAVKEGRHRAYEDFIAVAEDLVKRKVTSPAHLGCIGGSNGGLLVGNMLTMRPDLFGAVVCEAPLLDMQRYHKLLAGASWMGEYGNPDDPKEWEFIRTWSPYHNLRAGVKYPPTLFTSSTRDDRVHPGHARRMAYRMEQMGQDVLYYENVEGGHAGAANSPQRAFMSALAYTFAWKHLAAPSGR
jgi:prolyl oligopeptidase